MKVTNHKFEITMILILIGVIGLVLDIKLVIFVMLCVLFFSSVWLEEPKRKKVKDE